jgi:hypothetical protein
LPGDGSGAGWLAWVLDEDAMYRFDGAAWALAGIEGPAGADGDDGGDGSLIFIQTSAPSTSEPEGSVWVDSDSPNFDVYRLVSGVWIDQGIDLKGPAGATGAAGADGATGPTGPAGASSLTIVRAATAANVDLPGGGLANGTSHDGVTANTGDRILVTEQDSSEENGVYIVPASGAASRDAAFDTYDAHPGVYVSVMEGDSFADTLWRCTSDRGGTIDADGLVFTEFQGGVGGRELLTAARAYYVDGSSGDDANDGLSSGAGAFATLQKAADVIFGTLDLGGYDVTVNVAAGTYTAGLSVTSPQVGAGTISFIGDAATPPNVTISLSSGNCIGLGGAGTKLTVQGFKLETSNAAGLQVLSGANLTASDVEFGACGFTHIRAFGGVASIGAATISGNSQRFVSAENQGSINIGFATFTLTGTPAFASAFAYADRLSVISANTTIFSGSATGARYSVTLNSAINTFGGGASYFPGDSSGSTATGGQYN